MVVNPVACRPDEGRLGECRLDCRRADVAGDDGDDGLLLPLPPSRVCGLLRPASMSGSTRLDTARAAPTRSAGSVDESEPAALARDGVPKDSGAKAAASTDALSLEPASTPRPPAAMSSL